VRSDDLGQFGEFTGMVHPHLEHAELSVPRHTGKAQRDAGMVVVALDRAMHLAGRGAVEAGEQGFLGAGLAHRAGDADDLRSGAHAAGAAEGVQCGKAVPDEDVRVVAGLGHDRPRGALGKGLIKEQVPVAGLALHRDEQVAGADFARVERDATDGEVV